MSINDIHICRLMVHTQQIEEKKLKEKFKEPKKARTNNGNLSRSRSEKHGRSKFQQRFSIQEFSNALDPKFNKDSVSNP